MSCGSCRSLCSHWALGSSARALVAWSRSHRGREAARVPADRSARRVPAQVPQAWHRPAAPWLSRRWPAHREPAHREPVARQPSLRVPAANRTSATILIAPALSAPRAASRLSRMARAAPAASASKCVPRVQLTLTRKCKQASAVPLASQATHHRSAATPAKCYTRPRALRWSTSMRKAAARTRSA